jgi:uncharacterized paraquat-inducible protein A
MPGINEDTLERQELHCHACGMYVQFSLDTAINGNHVLNCPNCGHEHCRVVRGGKISDVRWDQRNGALQVYQVISVTFSVTSTAATSVNTNLYLMSASTGTGGY